MPQERCYGDPARAWKTFPVLQIKNIKLHIVTDIKVNFNSMLGFRISTFGWGDGYSIYQRNQSSWEQAVTDSRHHDLVPLIAMLSLALRPPYRSLLLYASKEAKNSWGFEQTKGWQLFPLHATSVVLDSYQLNINESQDRELSCLLRQHIY